MKNLLTKDNLNHLIDDFIQKSLNILLMNRVNRPSENDLKTLSNVMFLYKILVFH